MSGFEEKNLLGIIEKSINETFKNSGITFGKDDSFEKVKEKVVDSVKQSVKQGLKEVAQVTKKITKTPKFLSEAVVKSAKDFTLKTENLSPVAKKAHDALYRNYVKTFNDLSAKVDSANTANASSNHSDFRSLKLDETFNLNGVKLHELYFSNISDLDSQISTGDLPYMRLARDFGSFESWQFNFIACCLSARNGWAIVCYDPFTDKYHNYVVDGHTNNIPLLTIPVLVMDLWEHAYYKDYSHVTTGKQDYIIAMMKELNWAIVEARMNVAEKSRNLVDIYHLHPVVDDRAEKMMEKLAADKVKNETPDGYEYQGFDHPQNDVKTK